MKNFYLFLFSILFLISCDREDSFDTDFEKNKLSTARTGFIAPTNSSNVYDETGAIFAELFEAYYEHPNLPIQLDSIVTFIDEATSKHPYFLSHSDFDFSLFPTPKIQAILLSPETHLHDALDTSVLSTPAKAAFESFLSTLFLQIESDEKYETVYDSILDYESFVLDEHTYSGTEKKFLLRITSIARHALYHKNKRPKKNTDPDWNWLTTCIVGSVYGLNTDTPTSISVALKTGIGTE
ncbi:hypothetical protein [Flavobacterium sp.]|uniref:hypothetical protein n=1 Tax=Flavobacterium sp. TaxID=239 RepID=UPI002FD9D295